MAIRLTGLNSGLDTDAMVKELVSAYSTKKDKYVKAKTKHGKIPIPRYTAFTQVLFPK